MRFVRSYALFVVATLLTFGFALTMPVSHAGSVDAAAAGVIAAPLSTSPAPAAVDPVAELNSIIGAVQAHNWPLAVSLIAMLMAWLARVGSPLVSSHWAAFFHGKLAAAILSAVPGLFVVISHTAMAGLSWPPFVIAVVEYVVTMLIMSNPSLLSAKMSTTDVAAVAFPRLGVTQ